MGFDCKMRFDQSAQSENPEVIAPHWEVLHSFLSSPTSVLYNSLNPNVIGSALGRGPDVCDNLTPTARKLLIVKTERCPSG
jgi:hypothetical protein